MQIAAFNVLPSVISKEKILIVSQRKRVSTCAEVIIIIIIIIIMQPHMSPPKEWEC